MVDKKLLDALRNIKGRRIYQFYLDEKTGEITDITSSMEYVKPIRCKDCEYFTPMSIYGHGLCDIHCNGVGEPEVVSETYYCAWAERKDDE